MTHEQFVWYARTMGQFQSAMETIDACQQVIANAILSGDDKTLHAHIDKLYQHMLIAGDRSADLRFQSLLDRRDLDDNAA